MNGGGESLGGRLPVEALGYTRISQASGCQIDRLLIADPLKQSANDIGS
jgi:hypothetical protein